MTSRAPVTFRHLVTGPGRSNISVDRSLQTFPPERYSDLVRRRGGLISAPGKFTENSITTGSENRLTKLLLNVNIERSLGAVQVIMAPDNTVQDLIKAAIEIYVKDKRRPLLQFVNPDCFQLHYSQFSLESLKPDEKLINLGSRNFFLCLKSSYSINSSDSEKPKMSNKFAFPFIRLMDFLL